MNPVIEELAREHPELSFVALDADANRQTALSQQISRLEAELGLTLLHRGPKGVEPTPAGLEVLDRARDPRTGLGGAGRGPKFPEHVAIQTLAEERLCLLTARGDELSSSGDGLTIADLRGRSVIMPGRGTAPRSCSRTPSRWSDSARCPGSKPTRQRWSASLSARAWG